MADSTDPFSSSVIPFQVPEQVREFAEKGVLQVREGYAKFKDAAETHNGTAPELPSATLRQPGPARNRQVQHQFGL